MEGKLKKDAPYWMKRQQGRGEVGGKVGCKGGKKEKEKEVSSF